MGDDWGPGLLREGWFEVRGVCVWGEIEFVYTNSNFGFRLVVLV